MAGLECKYCKCQDIDTQVRVVYKSRIVLTMNSAIKAQNEARRLNFTPCTLKYVYACNNCGIEDLKRELYYDGS